MQEISEVIELGNAIAIANFKAQALRDPKFIDEVMNNFSKIAEKVDQIKSKTVRDHNKKYLAEIEGAATSYKNAILDLMSTWKELQGINKKRGETGGQLIKMTKEIADTGMGHTDEVAGTAVSALSSASRILTVGLALVLLLGFGMAYSIGRSITRPIHLVVGGLYESANQVASAAGQVSGASQQLAEGASEQAAAIEQTSSSLEEMSSMTKQNADHAGEAENPMAGRTGALDKANQSMDRLTSSMIEISTAVRKPQKSLKLSTRLLSKPNLLALNRRGRSSPGRGGGSGFCDSCRRSKKSCYAGCRGCKKYLESTGRDCEKDKGRIRTGKRNKLRIFTGGHKGCEDQRVDP